MSRLAASRSATAALVATLALFLAAGAILAGHSGFSVTDTLDAGVYAGLMLGMSVIGLMIARREPRNAVGWLFCLAPLLVAVSAGGSVIAIWAGPRHHDIPGAVVLGWLSIWAWPIGLVSFFMLLPLLFPDGRPPAGRWRILLRIDLVALAVTAAVLMTQPGEMFPGTRNPIGVQASGSVAVVAVVVGMVLVLIPAGLASAVVRYRGAGPTERLQLRECMLAAGATFAGFIAISALGGGEALYIVDYALIPAAVGLAMLRYRLYDVDVVIRRTLVYGVLVAALAAVYVGGIVLLGVTLRSVAGASSSFAVTLSTLAVAGAFQPLRGRIQRVVDRRFYRAAYDARAAVDAFSDQLRQQIDLDVLSERLLATVGETVRPRSATVWLAPVTVPERTSGTTEA